MVMIEPPGEQPDVRAVMVWADMAMADVHCRISVANKLPVYVIVPQGPRDRDVFTRAEAQLIARGMQLDWRHHPDELVRRTVADTLRLVSWWLPQEEHELLTGPAEAVHGWMPDGRGTCPLCQQTQCDPGGCPMRRVGVRPMFAAPSVVHMMGAPEWQVQADTGGLGGSRV